jgi:plastocyanin
MTSFIISQRRKVFLTMIALLALAGLAIAAHSAPALAADPPNQPFDLIFTATDEKLNIAQLSLGTFGADGGSVSEDIPGTAIRKAYLVWAGLGQDNDGVMFQRDVEAPVLIMPDRTWNNATFGGANTWDCCGGELSVYAADVTGMDIVQNGDHTYTLSDMELSHENWGYSLLVVFEDPALPTNNDIYIKLGNDGLHYRWGGMLGPNSDVQCVAFPSATFTRTANFAVVIGGIEDDFRPNGLWGMADSLPYVDPNAEGGTWTYDKGLITLPANGSYPAIDGVPGADELDGPLDGDMTGNGIDWPFTDDSGDQWDFYPQFGVSVEPGDEWACVQVESANRPELPPSPQPGFPNYNIGASIGFVGFMFLMPSSVQAEPAIDIEKATNGEDADTPTGPMVEAGDVVTWTYEVTNTGTVTLTNVAVTDDKIGAVTCPKDTLAASESMTCTMTGIATLGQYENNSTVEGFSPTQVRVTDQDPSHYLAVEPAIVIEKATNGEDADTPTGPVVEIGSTITWTYVVTNTGTVTLTNVAVTDDKIGDVACPKDTLTVGESMTCTMTGTAVQGQYENNSTVEGFSPAGTKVTDQDPSHYLAVEPAIDLEKATNGEDADTPTGPVVEVGSTVTWTYEVTNTGPVPLDNVKVTDDKIGDVTCPKDTLAVGESMTCTMTGTAILGQYENNSTVEGFSPDGIKVTDQDPSHYLAVEPTIDIEKATNGEDADQAPGPEIEEGKPVEWTYVVTNIGPITLYDVSVQDDKEGDIACPKTTLASQESMTCTHTGAAVIEQYANNSTVVGTSAGGTQVTDQDPSHYFGISPTAINDPDIVDPGVEHHYIYLPLGFTQ